MKYIFTDVDKVIPVYRRAVQKLYPDFDETKQYVLWIVADFWDDIRLYNIHGQVRLYDDQNQEIDTQLEFAVNAGQVVRKPYYNKGIRQVGIRKGRERIFGVPIVTDDVTKFEKIKKITVQWDILMPIFVDEQAPTPYEVCLCSLNVVHNVTFDMTNVDTNHWFTLSHQDILVDKSEQYAHKMAQIYDTIVALLGLQVELPDGVHVKINPDDSDVLILGMERNVDLDNPVSDHVNEILESMAKQPVNHLLNMFAEVNERVPLQVKWDLDRYHYETNVVLTADPYADIIPEPGFGFK